MVDGPVEARRAVRSLVERGADWVKVLITGGLYSEHESVDGGQFADDELVAVMQAAGARGIPVAAHCGSAQMARRFAELGGRSVEHGYALDEAAAAALAAAGTWLVPTIAVTHDEPMMVETGWPPHAHHRAVASAPAHAEALLACLAAGVRIATEQTSTRSGRGCTASWPCSRRLACRGSRCCTRPRSGAGSSPASAPRARRSRAVPRTSSSSMATRSMIFRSSAGPGRS